MSGRTVRLKRAELRLMRASELRRLMEALGVSSEGCLEKAELLGQLEQAADVVLEEDLEKVYEAEELRDLPLPLLRNLLERHRVIWNVEEELSEEEERVKVMQSLAESGWMGEAAREAMKKEEEKERPNEKPSEKKDEKLKSEEKENEKGNVQSEVDSEKQAEEKPLESPEDAEQTVKNEADGSGVVQNHCCMWLRSALPSFEAIKFGRRGPRALLLRTDGRAVELQRCGPFYPCLLGPFISH